MKKLKLLFMGMFLIMQAEASFTPMGASIESQSTLLKTLAEDETLQGFEIKSVEQLKTDKGIFFEVKLVDNLYKSNKENTLKYQIVENHDCEFSFCGFEAILVK